MKGGTSVWCGWTSLVWCDGSKVGLAGTGAGTRVRV